MYLATQFIGKKEKKTTRLHESLCDTVEIPTPIIPSKGKNRGVTPLLQTYLASKTKNIHPNVASDWIAQQVYKIEVKGGMSNRIL